MQIMPKKTVSGVLKTFQKAVNDLAKVEAQQLDEHLKQQAKAEQAMAMAEAAWGEAARAKNAREKIEGLLS